MQPQWRCKQKGCDVQINRNMCGYILAYLEAGSPDNGSVHQFTHLINEQIAVVISQITIT